MKRILKITVIILIIFLAISMSGQDKQETGTMQEEYLPDTNTDFTPNTNRDNTETAQNQKKTVDQNLKSQEEDNTDIDDDELPYQQDFISRKLFQKKLPPLSSKEKIIWAFRMADNNLFL